MYRQDSQMSQVWLPMSEPRLSQKKLIKGEKNSKNNNTSKPRKLRVLLYKLRMQTSLDDIRSLMFWKALFAEFLGTFFLVLVAVGSTVQSWRPDELDVVQIALTFGLAVATAVWIIGHISGGHINPAVTAAMLVTRRISLVRAVLYIVVQCAGSVTGAGLLKSLTPPAQHGGLGTTTLSEGVTPSMGFGIEFFITMLLVLTVFATCDSRRTDHGGSFPLTIGLSVTVGHLWAVEFCGSSMNPARSLGPAIVMNIWHDHWVYWVGPLCGGIFAGLLYDNIFAANASLAKCRDFLMTSQYDDDDYPARRTVIKVLEEEYEPVTIQPTESET